MADTQTRMNPLVAVAAASVIVFSAIGVGVMTGFIPSSFSKSADSAASAGPALGADGQIHAKAAERPAPASATGAPARAKAAEPAAKPAVREAAQPAKPAAVTVAPAVCADCGRIEAINVVEEKGEGTGLGAVAGGVVGGILGNQVGGGSGRKIATVAGVAGGAYAGHQIEKQVKATKRYEVVVRMDNGTSRRVSYDNDPGFRIGDKVKVVNGMLVSS